MVSYSPMIAENFMDLEFKNHDVHVGFFHFIQYNLLLYDLLNKWKKDFTHTF